MSCAAAFASTVATASAPRSRIWPTPLLNHSIPTSAPPLPRSFATVRRRYQYTVEFRVPAPRHARRIGKRLEGYFIAINGGHNGISLRCDDFELGEIDPDWSGLDDFNDATGGMILLDGLPLDEFIARHGRAEAERRIGEGFSQALDAEVAATIDDTGTVHIGERLS